MLDLQGEPLSHFMESSCRQYYATQASLHTREQAGDFLTSPHISQAFGEICACYLAHMFSLASYTECALVELGPGTGELMVDMLRTLKQVNISLYHKLSIHLVEKSPLLRQRQQQALLPFEKSIVWYACVEDLPQLPLFVIANEFFDSLPIDQLYFSNHQWRQVYVTPSGKRFFGPLTLHEKDIFAYHPDKTPDEGSILEISSMTLDITHKLARKIKKNGGCALIIDYGYKNKSFGDTLQAMHHHHRCDVFAQPGQVDITAHVSFSVLKEAALREGLTVTGPVTQKTFLDAMGLRQRIDDLKNRNEAHKDSLEKQYHYLAGDTGDPKDMGQLFKVLSFFA